MEKIPPPDLNNLVLSTAPNPNNEGTFGDYVVTGLDVLKPTDSKELDEMMKGLTERFISQDPSQRTLTLGEIQTIINLCVGVFTKLFEKHPDSIAGEAFGKKLDNISHYLIDTIFKNIGPSQVLAMIKGIKEGIKNYSLGKGFDRKQEEQYDWFQWTIEAFLESVEKKYEKPKGNGNW